MIHLSEAELARFWAKVDKNGPVVAGLPGRCWIWTAAKVGNTTKRAYGSFGLRGRNYRAHRIAYEVLRGPIPSRLLLMHACDNPPCCNPDHTRPATNRENMLDAKSKGRLSHGARHSAIMRLDTVAARGERNGSAHLTAAQVVVIRQLRAGGATLRAIASQFGVDFGTVGRIARNERWKTN